MTYPLIGNYGVNSGSDESRRPWIAGMIVREETDEPSHFQSEGTLGNYLNQHGIPALSGVDTRAVTRHIRATGDIRAAIVPLAAALSDHELTHLAQRAALPGETDVVGEVTELSIVEFASNQAPHIVVVDCGVKRNILRSLSRRGARATVVPYGTSWADIDRLRPDGIIVSPGPGDPANLDAGLDVVRRVLDSHIPYFGICLGHQLLARSIGATTSKLKFGHRGGNHPVREEQTGRVTITSQNHGFEVNRHSVPADGDWEVSMVNLNDGSIEGLRHRSRPVMTVQFHPEASPGPTDNDGLFDEFLLLIADHQGSSG
jgi:carbamoyl-phosphate synthase small subunit